MSQDSQEIQTVYIMDKTPNTSMTEESSGCINYQELKDTKKIDRKIPVIHT